MPLEDLVPTPGLRPGLLGMATLKGQPVAVMDLRARLALPGSPQGRQPKIVVLEIAGEDGPNLAGFVADRVSDVVTYHDRDLRGATLHGKGRPRRLIHFDELLTEEDCAGLWSFNP
jgi:chemotaxis signal transduction protein